MTPRSSSASAPAPPPRAVRRSLRALADGSAAEPSVSDPERVVADAEAAVACAREAVSYLIDGRLSRLDGAVATAERRDEAALARRGRRARATLGRLRAAVTDPCDRCGPAPSMGADSDVDRDADRDVYRDHFRPARGTVLGGSGQRPSR